MLKLTKVALSLLGAVIAATDSAAQCGYVAEGSAPAKSLVEAGLIELNAEIKDAKGETAARVTAAGREFATTGKLPEGVAAQTAEVSKPRFEIETGVELAPKTRAPIADKYPFEQLEVGQSFFVANDTVSSGNAYKTMGSTVTTANGKFSEETGEFRPHRRDHSKTVAVVRQLRKFELRQGTKTAEDGSVIEGARVHRVEV